MLQVLGLAVSLAPAGFKPATLVPSIGPSTTLAPTPLERILDKTNMVRLA